LPSGYQRRYKEPVALHPLREAGDTGSVLA
jgi:hypothetical protein